MSASEIALVGLVVLSVGIALTLVARRRAAGRGARPRDAFVIIVGFALLLAVHPSASSAATSPTCGQTRPAAPTLPITRPASSCGLLTRVALSADRVDTTLGSSVTFVAAVPGAGVVTFWDGVRSMGTALVEDGSATFTVVDLAAGQHQVSAAFTPTDPVGCSPDPSLPVVVGVGGSTAGAGGGSGGDVQTIQAQIGPGVLLLSSPYDAGHPLELGVLRLSGATLDYATSAEFGDGSVSGSLAVVDTRGVDDGWTVCVQGGDLSDPTGDVVSGSNVGFVDVAAIGVAGGPVVTVSDAPGPPVAVAPGTAVGLGARPQVIARSVGSGRGTAGLDGRVTLVAPAASRPGTYAGTLTFTVG